MRFHPVIIALVGLLFLGYLITSGHLKDHPSQNFEKEPPPEILKRSNLKFREIGVQLGFTLENQFWFPNPHLSKEALPLLSLYPSVSVYDINQDGYSDVLITYPWTYPRLYINQKGQNFTDESQVYGLDQISHPQSITRAVFFDYNNDHKVDLVLARYGCHTLLQGQGVGQKFVERKELDGFCSNANGINVLDFNRDGYMDLFFANYWPEQDLSMTIPLNPNLRSTQSLVPGGKSFILVNEGGQSFQRSTVIDNLNRNYTNNGAVTDFNDDGFPDLFVANDYSYDSYLINQNGKSFLDKTEELIPKHKHGMNGMNADFADFNKTGQLSFYVGEITAPPYSNYTNLLWVRNGDKYEERAVEFGVGRCGWTWSAKWSDFDNDGWQDLIVSTGRARGINATVSSTRSFRHSRTMVQSNPVWLRALDPTFDHVMHSDYHFSAFEKNCLFHQIDGRFYDVAAQSGISDLEEGYGLATLDFDNDGRTDFVIVNMPGRPMFYRNESPIIGTWLDLKLKSTKYLLVLGAKLKVQTNRHLSVIETYPTNGFNSQSEDKIHLSFAPDEELKEIEIQWPSGQVTRHQHFEFGKVNEVIEP